MKNRIPLLIILTFPVVVCVVAWYFWFSPATTIILVRHAERLNSSDTTSISEIGIERAQRLAHVLSASGVTRIYVSEKYRTTQTVAPTAMSVHVSPVPIPFNAIGAYIDSVKAHRGEVILIAGHSDNLTLIMAKLGIANPPVIERSQYDDIFIVTRLRFRSTLTRVKYGHPSF
ncbi:MAG: histidine phosphatase family protein [Ignavibacteriae bacterium]|nr:histidine phosphatase family protein [Ignavibacteriota bacterium]